jgi:hypothetical protein
MTDLPTLEIVMFQATEGTSDEALIAAAVAMNTWLTAQPGFIARRVGKAANGNWLDSVEWASADAAEQASAGFPSAPGAGAYMALIAQDSLAMHHYAVTHAA